MSGAPTNEQMWQEAFFMWVRAQVCSYDVYGGFKTVLGNVSIYLQGPDNKPARGSARGVIVIVVVNEHGDMSSNPGRD